MEFAVIFDMDGVLVDSGEAHFQAFSALGKELGLPYTRDFFVHTLGMHNRQIFPLWLGRDLDEAQLTTLAERKESLYRELARDTLKPLDGIPEILLELRARGVPFAVGSSGPSANVALALEILGAREDFSAIVCGDDIQRGKPDPQVFLLAAERLGAPPDRCVVIEDAAQGVAAARAAGMRVVAVTSTTSREALADADRIVDSLRELRPAPGTLRRIALGLVF